MRDIAEQEGSAADGRRLFKVERYSKRRQFGGSRLPNYDVRTELVVSNKNTVGTDGYTKLISKKSCKSELYCMGKGCN